MSLVVKDGVFGCLCRPYRRNWGQSPNSEILRTVPKFSLAPLQGSGGEWLPGEGSSKSDRIRHLRCLPHSGLYGFGNVAAASGPLRGSGGEWLPGEGSSVSDRIRNRHLRCLPHSGPCRFGNVAVASRPLRGSGGGWLPGEGRSVPDRIRHLRCLLHSGPCGPTSVRPYKMLMLRNHV